MVNGQITTRFKWVPARNSRRRLNAAVKFCRRTAGFTVIELMIAMALTVVVSGAVFATYRQQERLFQRQAEIAAAQQNLRAAMYLIERDIRMAGLDPEGTAGAGITLADPDEIRLTKDVNGNGSLMEDTNNDGIEDGFETNENEIYRMRDEDGDGVDDAIADNSDNSIAENITSLAFNYFDEDLVAVNNPNGNLDDIRYVEVVITAATERDNYIRTLRTIIRCRNLGI